MADDPEPPRKFYEFKPREFDRANALRPPAPAEPESPGKPADPNQPIDVRELHRQASVPGPMLSAAPRPVVQNEVHGILRENVAREKAAGLHDLAPLPPKRSRRRRDYAVLMLTVNGFLAVLATFGLRTGNVTLFVSSVAGIGMISAAITWVMWFIVDDY